MKKIVLLGCGGFIGSHLLEHLLAKYGQCLCLEGWDEDVSKINHILSAPNLTMNEADIYNSKSLETAIASADAVISMAAICNPSRYNTEPLAVIDSNFINAHKIPALCAKHKKWLIHFSTSEVYGRTLSSYKTGEPYADIRDYELKEDETPFILGPMQNQRWSYSCAKQLLERYIYGLHRQQSLEYTIIRPFNFFGPRMDYIPGYDGEGIPRIWGCFLAAFRNKEPLQLVDGGSAMRTFLYIQDAVEAISSMLDQPEKAKNQVFNLGNRANETTMSNLADVVKTTLFEITGNSLYQHYPVSNIKGEVFYGEGYEDSDRRLPDVSKAASLLGWQAKIPLKIGIKTTLSHYVDQGIIS